MYRDHSNFETVLKIPGSVVPGCDLRAAIAQTRRLRVARDAGLLAGHHRPADFDRAIDVPLVVSTLERLLTRHEEVVDLGRMLSRCATLIQLASPTIRMFVTSAPTVGVERRAAAALAVTVRELAHVLETCRRTPAVRLYLAVELSGTTLRVALCSPEAGAAPVPTGGAARSLAAAYRLARAAGGSLVRGVSDGAMVFALSFDWSAAVTGGTSPHV